MSSAERSIERVTQKYLDKMFEEFDAIAINNSLTNRDMHALVNNWLGDVVAEQYDDWIAESWEPVND